MKSLFRLALPFLFVVLCAMSSKTFAQARQFPPYSGHVNDFAKVIDPATKKKIDDILLNFEAKTGTQIAVVTMTTLGGQPLEHYSTDLYRAWGIGQKSGENRDKGVLLLVVIQDRKTRLEVGYGLEGDLPDGLAAEIIRNMRPDLQAASYSTALMKGARTIVDTLAVKWNVSLEGIEDRQFAYRQEKAPEISGKALAIFAGFFILFLILMAFAARSARRRMGTTAGRVAGEAIWWLAPLIFNRGGGSFGGGSSDSGGGWGGGSSDSGGSDWGGFGGGESGGGGASDSW
ncbi:MAG: TPM domain-containing protein [Acidobacteria bacterium]|nr:TPM domain-containing protein [Acidobacteriota bacterium]